MLADFNFKQSTSKQLAPLDQMTNSKSKKKNSAKSGLSNSLTKEKLSEQQKKNESKLTKQTSFQDVKQLPESLSNNIFATLYTSNTRVSAILQLIEWRKKRENLYSVRLSDGFYRIKVFCKGKVAKQFSLNQIKQFYILQCVLEYQGDKICELKTIENIYQYGLSIGFTEAWKFDKINFNSLGNSKIDWQKWDRFTHSIQEKVVQPILLNLKSSEQQNSLYEETLTLVKQAEKKIKKNDPQKKDQAENLTYENNQNQSELSLEALNTKMHSFQLKKKIETKSSYFSESQSYNDPFSHTNQFETIFDQTKDKIKTNQLKKTNPFYHQQINFSNLSKQFHSSMLIKSKDKPKFLILKDEQSQQASQFFNSFLIKPGKTQTNDFLDNQRLIDFKQPASQEVINSLSMINNQQTVDKQPAVPNEEQKTLFEDSLDDFFKQFVIFRTNKLAKDGDFTMNQAQMKREEKNRKEIIKSLLEDSDEEDKFSNLISHSVHHRQKPAKQSQIYSPQPIKNRNSFENSITSLLNQLSQDQYLHSPHKQHPDFQQKKIEVGSSSKKYSNSEIRTDKKKDSPSANIIKDVFNQIMREAQIEFESQTKGSSVEKQTNQTNFKDLFTKNNQNYTISSHKQTQLSIQRGTQSGREKKIEKKIYEIKDLIELKKSTANLLGLNKKKKLEKWFLKGKILYIKKFENKNKKESILSCVKNQSIVSTITVSSDFQFLCTLMIDQELIAKYNLQENQQYLFQEPKIVIMQTQNQNGCYKFPKNMFPHWIQASRECIVINYPQPLEYQCFQREPWLDQLKDVVDKDVGDVVNILGYIKSIHQKTLSYQNSKLQYPHQSSDLNNDHSAARKFKCSIMETTKTVTVLQIVDPVSKYQVVYTDFGDVSNSFQKYQPIAIIRAHVRHQNGQKSLVSKPQTIVIFKKFLKAPRFRFLEQFHNKNSQNLHQILSVSFAQTNKYKLLLSALETLHLEQYQKCYLEECKIFTMSKISYFGCKNCNRKIFQGKCVFCGISKQVDIFQKTLFTGVVGDDTASLKYFVEQDVLEQELQQYLKLKNQSSIQSLSNAQNLPSQTDFWREDGTVEDIFSLRFAKIWFLYQDKEKPISIQKIQIQSSTSRSVDKLVEYLKNLQGKGSQEQFL